MQVFRAISEIHQARLPPKIHLAVMRAMQNLVEAYGEDCGDDNFVVLVERTTTDQDSLDHFGQTWENLILEGVTYQRDTNTWATCWLSSNDSGATIIIPRESWIHPNLKEKLDCEMGVRCEL